MHDCLPAQLRIPFQGVNVEEHSATGIRNICAVDAPVPTPCQALRKQNTGLSVHQMLQIKCCMVAGLNRSYPDDPGVYCAKHGTFTQHCLLHLIHIVQQPTQLHCTEVGADGKACLVLEHKHRLKYLM